MNSSNMFDNYDPYSGFEFTNFEMKKYMNKVLDCTKWRWITNISGGTVITPLMFKGHSYGPVRATKYHSIIELYKMRYVGFYMLIK